MVVQTTQQRCTQSEQQVTAGFIYFCYIGKNIIRIETSNERRIKITLYKASAFNSLSML